MYILKIKFSIFLFFIGNTFFCLSCQNYADSKSFAPPVSSLSQEMTPNKPKSKVPDKEESFSSNGISFRYVQSLADEILVKKVNTNPVCDPNFRPDACEIQHLSYQLAGDYASQYPPSSFHPELTVYPIAEYLKVFQVSEDFSAEVDDRFQNLKLTLTEQPSDIIGECPFIPFLDSTQLMHSHVSYLSFVNGKGIAFITQFNGGDPILINNERIVYVFQGLTSDGKYLISATFPLKTSFLPEDSTVTSYKDYKVPENYHVRENYLLNEANYKKYVSNVKQELDAVTEEQFTPNLEDIKKLISSLEIKPNFKGKVNQTAQNNK